MAIYCSSMVPSGHREQTDIICIVDRAWITSSSGWPSILTCAWETCNYVDENTVVVISIPDYGGHFTAIYVRQIVTQDRAVQVALAASDDFSVQAPILIGDPLIHAGSLLLRRRGVSSPLSSFQIDEHLKFQVVMEHLKSIGSLSVICSLVSSNTNNPSYHLNRLKCWVSSEIPPKLTIEVDICSAESVKCVLFQISLYDTFILSENSEARGSLHSDKTAIVLRLSCPPSLSVPSSSTDTQLEILRDICCGFCGHTLALGESIHEVRSMPLGLLDHVSNDRLIVEKLYLI